jgi:hypothetical protein
MIFNIQFGLFLCILTMTIDYKKKTDFTNKSLSTQNISICDKIFCFLTLRYREAILNWCKQRVEFCTFYHYKSIWLVQIWTMLQFDWWKIFELESTRKFTIINVQRDQQWLSLLAMKQLKNTGVFCLVIRTHSIF